MFQLTTPKFQAFDNNGVYLVGGYLYTYLSGTDTPSVTYSNFELTSENENPIELDARGEATIYGIGLYKFVLKDANDATIWTIDPVSASAVTPWYVTPEQYGAIGDGTTDDQAAIQAAIDANDWVMFGPKTYRITYTLYNTGGKILSGCGHSSTLYCDPTDPLNYGAQAIQAGTNCIIKDMWIKGTYTTLPWHGGVPTIPWHAGIVSDDPCSGITVWNCKISNFAGNGIWMGGALVSHITGNFISNCANEGIILYGEDGASTRASDRNIIDRNFIYDCLSWGIDVNGSDNIVSSNIIYNCGSTQNPYKTYDGGGIVIYDAGLGASNNLVSNNRVDTSELTGIRVFGYFDGSKGHTHGNAVIGNIIKNIGSLDVSFNSNGIVTELTDDVTVTGNNIDTVIGKTTQNVAGIRGLDIIGATITGNIIKGVTGNTQYSSGLYFTGNTGQRNITIVGNNVRNSDNGAFVAYQSDMDALIFTNNNLVNNDLPMSVDSDLFVGTNIHVADNTGVNNFRSSASTPVGAVTPYYIGEEFLHTTGNHWFKATGLTNSDWSALS